MEMEQLITTLKGHEDNVRTLISFSSKKNCILSCSTDGTIRKWNIKTGDNIILFSAEENDGLVNESPKKIYRMTLSSDDKFIAFARFSDSYISVLSLQMRTPSSHNSSSTPSSSSGTLGSDDRDGALVTSIRRLPLELATQDDCNVWSIAFSCDGKFLVCSRKNYIIHIWETGEYNLLHTLNNPGHRDLVFSLYFRPFAPEFASASLDGIVKIWNAVTGTCLSTLQLRNDEIISNRSDGIYVVAFCSNDLYFASGSINGWLQIALLSGLKNRKHSATFDNDDVVGHSVHQDSSFADHTNFHVQGHQAAIFALSFSNDSKLLLSGSFDFNVCLWSTEKFERLRVIENRFRVYSVAFACNDEYICWTRGNKICVLRNFDSDEYFGDVKNAASCC